VKRESSKEIKILKDELNRQDSNWGVDANHSIFRASTTISIYLFMKLYKNKVTQRSTAILNLLVQHDGEIAQKRLAKSLDLTKQAVASALRNLENHHLITRETGSRDGRSNIVKITEAGLKVEKNVLPIRKAFYDLVMESMSEKEARQLIKILTRLSDKLNADIKRTKSLKNSIAEDEIESI
jgi:DNA-binding MarR family transcriptional regulator